MFTNERRQAADQLTMRLIYVTPYPIVPSKEKWGSTEYQGNLTGTPAGSMGPYAGDNSVLYKRLDLNQNPAGDENWTPELIFTEEFRILNPRKRMTTLGILRMSILLV